MMPFVTLGCLESRQADLTSLVMCSPGRLHESV